MKYQRKYSVMCLGDPKQSALYFDKIIPLSFLLSLRSELGGKLTNNLEIEKHMQHTKNLMRELFPLSDDIDIDPLIRTFEALKLLMDAIDSAKTEREIDETIIIPEKEMVIFYSNVLLSITYDKDPLKTTEEEIDKAFINRFNAAFQIFMSNSDLHNLSSSFISLLYYLDASIKVKDTNYPIRSIIAAIAGYYKEDRIPIILSSTPYDIFKPEEDDLTFSIVNYPIVNTEKTDWDHIIEFRKDDESRKKLRSLRLFLHHNYEGKNRAFIEDDLGRRLEDYENTCKDWGFETKEAILSTLSNSNSLIATTALAIGAIYFDDLSIKAGLPIAGAFLNIGKIALTYAKQKHAFHRIKGNHELAYIIEAKERLEKN